VNFYYILLQSTAHLFIYKSFLVELCQDVLMQIKALTVSL